jgi:hypothetical protein
MLGRDFAGPVDKLPRRVRQSGGEPQISNELQEIG